MPPEVEVWNLNHWTAKEVPLNLGLVFKGVEDTSEWRKLGRGFPGPTVVKNYKENIFMAQTTTMMWSLT